MKDLTSFETAKLAKEVGFDECVLNHYYSTEGMNTGKDGDIDMFMDDVKNSEIEYDEYSAPTKSELQTWLREKGLIVTAVPWTYDVCDSFESDGTWSVSVHLNHLKIEDGFRLMIDRTDFESYEDALEAGNYEACKILKDETTR